MQRQYTSRQTLRSFLGFEVPYTMTDSSVEHLKPNVGE